MTPPWVSFTGYSDLAMASPLPRSHLALAGEVWAHGGVFLLLTILACVSPVFVDRHAGFGRVCTYSRCGIRIRPNQIELIGVDLVVDLGFEPSVPSRPSASSASLLQSGLKL